MICAHCIRRRKALVAEKSKQAAKMIRVAEELRAVLKRYPKKGPAQIKFSVLQRLSREAPHPILRSFGLKLNRNSKYTHTRSRTYPDWTAI